MEQVKRLPGALLFAGLLVVALIILMAIPNSWEEATTRNKDGSYSISKEWEESIDRFLRVKKPNLIGIVWFCRQVIII